MNPMEMMKLAGRLGIFNQQHPKFGKFLKAVAAKGLTEGSVMEVKFKATDGKEYVANIKMTPEDIETIDMIRSMGQTS
ncbi:hypothetical protein SAMN06297422_12718 [Lachnospiraceae bacterium]|nr:hypothetical protein SAMN06297422_12718 [Lachnospiraceae bacterium]